MNKIDEDQRQLLDPTLDRTAVTADVVDRLDNGYDVEPARGGRLRALVDRFTASPAPSFVLFVLVPTFFLALYFAFIASNQWVSETRLVVHQVEQVGAGITIKGSSSSPTAGANGGGMAGGSGKSSNSQAGTTTTPTGPSTAAGGGGSISVKSDQGDAYLVASYINSRAIVYDLLKTINLREVFRRPEVDFWARLPADATIDELESYWLAMVNAYIDGPSGIVIVKVHGFRPEDCLLLAQAINDLSSKLVNDISVRARQDALTRAQAEVKLSEDKYRAALGALEAFRDREGLIDPTMAATSDTGLLRQVLADHIATETDLFVTRRLSADSPEIPMLEARLHAIDSRIAELQSKLTGNDEKIRTLAASLATFEELQVKEGLAEQMYTLARVSEERARESTERRWLYASVFVPPTLPDEPAYPRRVAFTLIGATICFMFWSIAALIWASVMDHRL